MHKRRLLLMPLPLFAASCAVGPRYVPPQPPAAAADAFVTRAPGFDAASQPAQDWWRLYRDPGLDALIEQALIANTDLRAAAANLAKSRAVMTEARAGRLPSTSLSGGLSRGNGPDSGGGGATNDGSQWSQNGGIALSWEVDLFGRVGRTIDAASADTEAVEAVRDAVRVTIVAETTRAYLDVCTSAHALAIAQESVQTSGDVLRLVSAQERAGSVGRLEVERAGAAGASARASLAPLEAQRQVALFELAALTGGTPQDVPAAARTCSVIPEPLGAIAVGDGAALLRRRPDLRQAERQLAADTARIGVATADLYPRISLGGSGNFFRNDTVRGGDAFSFSLGPLISWSFPNTSVARARLRGAQAQGESSLAQFDGRVLQALKEVEQALTLVAAAQTRLSNLAEALRRTQIAFDIAKQRYAAGAASFLDLLSAQGDLLAARSAQASAQQQLSSRRVDLFKALGGGWEGASAP
ncbi:transporter [Sphingopyxis sp. Root214]|uniref:efflux transporter outer membrane subunit n=1 Tax=unclassified Sphingopyxis TaxID=2614943 RepID=UPI0006FFA458|nr:MULTISPECIES: TolC family protein [unclassified Sphingopyxis]KQZ76637.1 transporter [Sphingopyxis sp. Root154]KRC09476.1 transporter [Sphingopyxis sp. Root214]